MKSHSTKPRLSWRTILSYSVGDLFGGGAFTLVGLLFLKYLTDSALIAGSIAGSMLLIGKIWDALIDPFIGSLSDRARSRHGRRRVFFLAGIFHIVAAFALLWLPLQAEMWVKVIYYTVAYLLFATSFSMTMVPYHAMLPDLTSDYGERNRIVGVRSVLSNFSTLLSGVVPMMIINAFVSQQNGYFGMGIAFGIFYAIPWIFVFRGTKGYDRSSVTDEGKTYSLIKGFFTNAKQVSRNRTYRIQLATYILAYTATDIFMAILLYYIDDYLFMHASYTALIGIFIITQMIFVAVYVKLANRIGKKKAFMLGAGIWSLGLVMGLFMNPEAPVAFLYVIAFVMGAGASGTAFLPWAMLPEITDVEQLISSKRREGIYSGFMTFLRQLAQAIALFLTGVYIDLIGYQVPLIPGETLLQSLQTQQGIKWFFSLAPVLLLLAAIVVVRRYPINPETYRIMKEEIARRSAGEPAEKVSPETKRVCELVSGHPYENLWKDDSTNDASA